MEYSFSLYHRYFYSILYLNESVFNFRSIVEITVNDYEFPSLSVSINSDKTIFNFVRVGIMFVFNQCSDLTFYLEHNVSVNF